MCEARYALLYHRPTRNPYNKWRWTAEPVVLFSFVAKKRHETKNKRLKSEKYVCINRGKKYRSADRFWSMQIDRFKESWFIQTFDHSEEVKTGSVVSYIFQRKMTLFIVLWTSCRFFGNFRQDIYTLALIELVIHSIILANDCIKSRWK